jgi:hypothetical protein
MIILGLRRIFFGLAMVEIRKLIWQSLTATPYSGSIGLQAHRGAADPLSLQVSS